MCLAPFCKAQAWIQHKRQVNNTNFTLINRSIPAIFFKTALALLRPRHTDLVQTPVNNCASQTGRPLLIKCSITLRELVETVHKDIVDLRESRLELEE